MVGIAKHMGVAFNHGSLLGLIDDDHTQYPLVDGTRSFTGVITGVTPISSTDLATKGYVDTAVSGVDQHSELSGLSADDHTQYILADGTRAFTGKVVGITPTADAHLATKAYVDTSVSGVDAHNELSGLSADDHTQYLLVDGTRAFSGVVVGVDPTLSTHLTTKNYVDGEITTLSGSTDHGGLLGLSDDDHTQYLLADGTRALTADWDIGSGRVISADKIQARSASGLSLFEDGGLGIFVQDTSGNVGIGTTSPANTLEVHVDTSKTDPIRMAKDQGANQHGASMAFIGGTDGAIERGQLGFAHTGSNADTILTGETADAMILKAVGAFQLGTGGGNIRMTIDSSGNVGIGTTSPAYGLDVSGTTRLLGDTLITGNLTVSGTQFATQHETVQITDNLLLINNGEVGAGVTASGSIAGIEVDRGTLTNYRFVFDENDDNFQIGEIGDLQAVATREGSPTASGIPYWNSSQNRFDTDGAMLFTGGVLYASEMGVGVTSPVARLEVNDGGTAKDILLKVTADDATPYPFMVGNDTYSTTDTNGVGILQNNAGLGQILNVATNCIYLDTSGGVKLSAGSQYVNEFSTDGTLVGNSDTAIPTEQAVKTYVDGVIDSPENIDVDTGTETVDSFADTTGDGCVWHYTVKNGVNLRTGTVMACWDSSNNVEYTEVATNSLGTTTGLTLSVDISANVVRLRATASTDNWSVKTRRMLM